MRASQIRALLPALALAAPALGLAQEAPNTTPGASTPVQSQPAAVSAPAVGTPGAVVPDAALPGMSLLIPGLTAAGATGLTEMPAEYTNYGVSAGVGASDNANLSSTGAKTEALTAANLFFDLIRSGSRLDLNALGNFSDTYYLAHASRNEVLGRFDGLANLWLWQRHLRWLLREDYGDSQVNVLQSLNPVNLQRVNVFSTGPALMLQPTVLSFVEMQALYSRDTWQDSPFNGQSEMGSLAVGHRFSPSSSLSLEGLIRQQQFDDRSVNTNYQIREYYGHYALRGARTVVDFQGGVDQADDSGSWKSSPLVRLSLTRNLSPSSTIAVSGGHDYINAMDSFAGLATDTSGGIAIGSPAQTTANAVQTYGNARWGFRYLRTTIGLFGGWRRNAYDIESKYDFTQANIGLNLGRRITPRLSANIITTLYRSHYGAQDFTETLGMVGGGLIYHLTEQVVIYGRYDHQLQKFTGPRGFSYDQNRVLVMIGYYPHYSGSGLPQGMGGSGLR